MGISFISRGIIKRFRYSFFKIDKESTIMKRISTVLILFLVVSTTQTYAQKGSTSRVAGFKKAKIKLRGAEPPLIRMFSKDELMRRSMELFANQGNKVTGEIPALLDGLLYYEVSSKLNHSYSIIEAGEVLAITPSNEKVDRGLELVNLGFKVIDSIAPFQLFGENPADIVKVYSKSVAEGETLTLPAWTILTGFEVERIPRSGELLYNGIRLPQQWPPIIDWSSPEPMPVPYLKNPPQLININVGRQLFVDNFLVEQTDLEAEYHYPQKYEGNPILKPETEIEKKGLNNLAVSGPKSGGLWWNHEKQLFEFWYEAGWVTTIAYATSKDGLKWERPDLKLNPGTNQVLPSNIKPDSWTVVPDYLYTDPDQKYKIFLRGGGSRDRARAFVTGNSTEWGKMYEGGLTGDRSTMFYNPFRKKWVYSLRWLGPGKRSRGYWESDDFLAGLQWLPDEPYAWARTDKLDPADPVIKEAPQLYNLDAVAYESVILGFYEILHGPANDINAAKGWPKYTGLNFAYSRDGFHWDRPDRKMAINSEQKPVWDRGYVQSLGNLCTVRGDKLWFYYIGFAGDEKVRLGDSGVKNSMYSGLYGNGATGVAFLRRDGFVSLNTKTTGSGLLLTRPLTFSGKYLFVNVDAPKGALYAEAVDMNGNVIEPFSFKNCIPAKGDVTLIQVQWKSGSDLSILNNRAVRFRFKMVNGKLYSFWVSRDETGRSDGYVAGGGPGFSSNMDNVGIGAYQAEKKVSGSLPVFEPK